MMHAKIFCLGELVWSSIIVVASDVTAVAHRWPVGASTKAFIAITLYKSVISINLLNLTLTLIFLFTVFCYNTEKHYAFL